ncbi:sugar ABC transporter permease [Streptomyces sp. NPDC127061]|uniref:sugar ABC transporter permease n=1 Tax=unclassified Streptomyces TaxID=2593676 RepID=UPI000F5C0365|nr:MULTISPECIES: sugar ABC transporter permease [unclassified Streptomyces]WSG54081.1 sugar ABC transporter permease [Streptomyces sp. NBC_01732]WSX04711.1 sugar ABC transporter permease [Streptomyces sp. NBC_00987]MCX4393007.1 sugar ABC transporter permease [Streptomyces sp. NBC_01767]MCX5105126.1 sugar ABC transporter permease [Streptomyces sp. NBC_00439]MCX5163822.1 sugar ABC transporter permease [Streptomyces sp. NBC_00305]
MSDLAKTPGTPTEESATEKSAAAVPEAGPSAAPAPAIDPRLLVREEGFKGYWSEFTRKVRGGELGSLPVLVGLIVIAVVFQFQNSNFLSASSIANVAVYSSGLGIMAVGIVFVLLLGEIDLSVGSVAGVGAAVWAVLSVNHGWNDWTAVLVAVLSGMVLGALHGFFFAKIGVPAFVVTLAGFLGWSGLQEWMMGGEGSINTPSGSIVENLTNYFFEDKAVAYGVALVAVLAYAASLLMDSRRRGAAGLPARPTTEVLLRTGIVAVLCFAVAYVLNEPSGARGLPLALVIFLAVLVVADFVARRTTFGRQVFAVGGNPEAARRAGIDVDRIRIIVFALSGMLGAFGGLFIASLSGGATKSVGGGNTLMLVIAAAVIGGTSLFGGRGKVWSALLGMIVIQSIQQGLNMIGMANAIQYMITGAVLLAAVVIDSVSRRTQKTAGRA